MMMKDLIIRNAGSEPHDDYPEFEELARLSPQGVEYHHDPYRCPVSTPAGYERTEDRERNNSYLSFTTMNRSYQIPNDMSVPKQRGVRMAKTRPPTKPQKKNFDCYFIEHGEKQPVRRETSWLGGLCAQPVNEIFHKYKRRSEAKYMAHRNSFKCRNVSTPGEKALVFAWSSNSSQRASSPSLVTRSVKSDATKITRRSNPESSLRVHGYESDAEKYMSSSSPGFALMPVQSPSIPEADSASWSSAGSVHHHKVVNKNVNFNGGVTNENTNTNLATNIYEPYTREKRFPVIKRKKSLSPAKKRLPSEPMKHATSLPSGMNELEESPIEIISVGSLVNNYVEPQKAAPAKPFCSYRLPKNPPPSLPEIKGNG